MNKRTKLLVGAGLAVLLVTALMATSVLAQGTAPYGQQGRQGWDGRMGRGMMGGNGRGMMGGWQNGNPSTTITNTQPFGGYGPGMRGGYGPGMMGGGMMGGGMMGGYGPGMMGGWTSPANANPISPDQAVAAAQQYVATYNNNDLALAEIMQFANNFYVRVTEKSTGTSAFELLVNPYSGAVTPEMGPNMMWNTKYGMMAQGGMMGMMGGYRNQPEGQMSVSVAQARTNAQQFLDANFPGAKLADDQDAFYGYYTMDFLQNGKTAGMLSVNGYTGEVWYHTWHGNFIAERAL